MNDLAVKVLKRWISREHKAGRPGTD